MRQNLRVTRGALASFMAVGLAAFVASGCGSSGEGQTVTLRGVVTFDGNGAGCTDVGGFEDIAPGTAVTVTNEQDAVIATGTLTSGNASATLCRFPFSIQNVPRAQLYNLEVSDRGALTFSASDLKKMKYDVEVDLSAAS